MAIGTDTTSPAYKCAELWKKQKRQLFDKLLSIVGDKITVEEFKILGIHKPKENENGNP